MQENSFNHRMGFYFHTDPGVPATFIVAVESALLNNLFFAVIRIVSIIILI